MTRLSLSITFVAHDDEGHPQDPLAVLEPAIQRLRMLGIIPRNAEFTFGAPVRSSTTAVATIRTEIVVEGAQSDFASDVNRAVLAVQILGLISRKEDV